MAYCATCSEFKDIPFWVCRGKSYPGSFMKLVFNTVLHLFAYAVIFALIFAPMGFFSRKRK